MTRESSPIQEALPIFQTPESLTAVAEARLIEANALVDEALRSAATAEADLSYEDTMGVLDRVRDVVGWEGEAGRLEMLVAAVHPDASMREAAGKAQGHLEDSWRGVFFNPNLYHVLKRFSETDAAARLEPEQQRALSSAMVQFRLAGQELEPAQREVLRSLHARLGAIGREFLENVSQGGATKLALSPEQLDGLPQTSIEGLDQTDEGMRIIGLNDSHVNTVLSYANNRMVREAVYRAFNSVGVPRNRELITEAAELRLRVAQLLGYESWAHMQLEGQMAGSPEAVEAFYGQLANPLRAKVTSEIAAMESLLVADGHQGPVQAYDIPYYKTKIRESLNVNDKEIAEYLPIDAVLEGLFSITGNVFGVQYEEIPNAGAWHEDVRAYRMMDAGTGEPIATFYLDLFPRDGKRTGGATYTLEYGHKLGPAEYQQPVTYVVANLTPPGADGTPSLLQPGDLRALFHEFGHVLHTSFARTETVQYSGDNTEQDFREAPSQMLEKWATIPGVIRQLARHYQTGAPIPEALIERLPDVQQITSGLDAMRLLQFGVFDAGMHDGIAPKDVAAIYQEAERASGTPSIEGIDWSARFRHLFIEQYAGRFYCYLWANVYAAEILDTFQAPNANPEVVGRQYREMLTHGGALPARQILEEFLGRPSDQRAFLRRLGLA